jgi:hypothetical protein
VACGFCGHRLACACKQCYMCAAHVPWHGLQAISPCLVAQPTVCHAHVVCHFPQCECIRTECSVERLTSHRVTGCDSCMFVLFKIAATTVSRSHAMWRNFAGPAGYWRLQQPAESSNHILSSSSAVQQLQVEVRPQCLVTVGWNSSTHHDRVSSPQHTVYVCC